ncbi:MAG: hypothetical protein RXR47_04660 [Nitrososphaeria archaeon]|jgi:hypothetical protein
MLDALMCTYPSSTGFGRNPIARSASASIGTSFHPSPTATTKPGRSSSFSDLAAAPLSGNLSSTSFRRPSSNRSLWDRNLS